MLCLFFFVFCGDYLQGFFEGLFEGLFKMVYLNSLFKMVYLKKICKSPKKRTVKMINWVHRKHRDKV